MTLYEHLKDVSSWGMKRDERLFVAASVLCLCQRLAVRYMWWSFKSLSEAL